MLIQPGIDCWPAPMCSRVTRPAGSARPARLAEDPHRRSVFTTDGSGASRRGPPAESRVLGFFQESEEVQCDGSCRRSPSRRWVSVLRTPSAQTTGDIVGPRHRRTGRRPSRRDRRGARARRSRACARASRTRRAPTAWCCCRPAPTRSRRPSRGSRRPRATVVVGLGKTSTGDMRLRPTATRRGRRHGRGAPDRPDVGDDRQQHRQPADQVPADRPQLHLDRPDLGRASRRRRPTRPPSRTRSSINGSTGLENASSSTASSRTASSTARRARTSTTSSSRSSRSRPAATRPSSAARRAASSTSSRSPGGNEFHGEAFVYYDNNSLQAYEQAPRGLAAVLLHLGLQPARLRLRPRRLRPEGHASGSSAPTTACRTRPSRR